MLKKLLVTTCLSALIFGFMLFYCTLPMPPAGPEEAKVSLLFKSSDGKIDGTGSIIDSVGKEVQIGVILHLTKYIDSSTVRVISGKDTIRTFPWAFKKNIVDTVFFSITFTKAGMHKVVVTSYITGQPNSVAEGKIIIYGPLPENRKPELKIPGAQSAVIGQTVSFTVSASDPDAGQLVTINASQKPEGATFTADTFRWAPGGLDTGTVKVIFIATDNGVPVLSDIDTVNIVVSAKKVNHAPQWNTKSVQRTVKTGTQILYDLGSICSDPDSEKVTFSLISAPPAKDTIIGNVYSFTPTAADTGKHTIHIFAKDSLGLTDTLALGLTVSAIKIPDSVPPVITIQSPATDTVISADSFEVKVSCLDDSGCSVKGFRDGTAFTLKNSTSTPNIWTGIVKGFFAGSYSTIKIVATDSSAAKNKDSVSIKIKYDNDKNGPIITFVIPVKDSVTINTDSYIVALKITDPSGVLSVNGTAGATSLTCVRDTGSIWKISINNLENNKTTVVVLSATDSSLKANKTVDTVYIRSEIVNGYTIKFDKNDNAATGTMADQTINSGDSAKLSVNTFTKDGSTFGGWMTTPAGTAIAYSDGTMFKMGTSNVTLYVKWIKKATFALTITATNGSVTKSPNAAAYDSGSTVGLKASASTGYKFINWTGDTSGTTDSTTVVVNKGTNVTANFAPIPYTVTFSSQGTTYLTATVNYNALATEPAVPQGGNCDTFGGWYTSGTYVTKWNFLTDKVTSDTTLFAKWTKQTYIVTYNANGGSEAVPVDNNKYENGQVVTVLGAGSLSRTNYTFTGWNTQADTLGTTFDVTFTMGNANVILYAKWQMNAPVISTHPANKTCPVNDSVTFTIVATGANLRYQWQKNNSNIAGATLTSYTPPALAVADTTGAATYRCIVSNAGGSITSNVATLSISTLTDADGNVYHQVKIGTQIWTMENLRVGKYSDRTAIPLDTSSATWNASTPKFCFYNNTTNADSIKKYGALYNWYVVSPTNTRKIAPAGWHVPTDEEWDILQNYLIANGYNWDSTRTGNRIAKSMAAKTDWGTTSIEGSIGKDLTINNSSGFSAFGVGSRRNTGIFGGHANYAFWWCSSEDDALYAWDRYLYWENASLERYGDSKSCGLSVRLLKD